MINRVLFVAVISLSLFACTAGPDTAGAATVVFGAEYAEAGGGPRSIGGYGVFGRLTTPDGDQVWADEIRFVPIGQAMALDQAVEVAPGNYDLTIDIQAASDVIENGRRSFMGTTANCGANLAMDAGDVLALTVTVVGGSSCSVRQTN